MIDEYATGLDAIVAIVARDFGLDRSEIITPANRRTYNERHLAARCAVVVAARGLPARPSWPEIARLINRRHPSAHDLAHKAPRFNKQMPNGMLVSQYADKILTKVEDEIERIGRLSDMIETVHHHQREDHENRMG